MLKFNRIMWKSVTNDTFKILQPLPNCKFDIWQMEQKAWENLNQDGLLYIELTISFLIGQKRTVNFQNQQLWRHLCRLSRTVKVTGNPVKFARFVLLAASEEAKTWLPFFFVQCIIKQLLDSVFVTSRIIKVSATVISLSLRLRLINPTSTLIILDITKISSNNCL